MKKRVFFSIGLSIFAVCAIFFALANKPQGVMPVLTSTEKAPRMMMPVESVQKNHGSILNQLPVELTSSTRSFGSQKDLWKFVQAAINSGSAPSLFEARSAISTCAQITATDSATANFVSGGEHTGINGALTPERQLAVIELKKRCDGFIKAGLDVTTKMQRELKKQLISVSDDAYDISPGQADVPKSRVRDLLTSDSAEARTIAAFVAAGHWQAAMGIENDDPRSAEVTTAITLATCDLSADCTSQGTIALTACVFADQCDRGVMEGWETNLSEDQIKSIQAYKEIFEAAVKKRDWITLGLGN